MFHNLPLCETEIPSINPNVRRGSGFLKLKFCTAISANYQFADGPTCEFTHVSPEYLNDQQRMSATRRRECQTAQWRNPHVGFSLGHAHRRCTWANGLGCCLQLFQARLVGPPPLLRAISSAALTRSHLPFCDGQLGFYACYRLRFSSGHDGRRAATGRRSSHWGFASSASFLSS